MGCFEDSALVNFPLAFWKNDLQGDGRNKTCIKIGEGKVEADGLPIHRHSRKSVSKVSTTDGSLPPKPQPKSPPNLYCFKAEM